MSWMKLIEGWKNGKTYKVAEFETFEECEDYWMTFFLHEPKYKTKVIGKTIIYWPVEEKEAA
tara:strand:- start:94 stop:279 length:186 start_codon:yes stop_codon:yes gene_type:complete